MIFISTGESVVARASSQGDLLRYLQQNEWTYIAFDYLDDTWFFANRKEALLLAVFHLECFRFSYEQNCWHINDLDVAKFGAMNLSPWHEDSDTEEFLSPDASHEKLIGACWVHAQLMESFMGVKFFAPYREMIEESWCSVDRFIDYQGWKKNGGE